LTDTVLADTVGDARKTGGSHHVVRILPGNGTSDLRVDYDGLNRFADELDGLRGQWDGSRPELDPTLGLGGAADLTEAVAEFTNEWAAAAKVIDSFMTMLSTMCRTAVQAYSATDHGLAAVDASVGSGGRHYAV